MTLGSDDARARFQAAMALVDRALDLDEDAREALLSRECADASLRAEVERLLAADASSDGRLAQPAGARVPSALRAVRDARDRSASRAQAGLAVGPFRLLSLLGRGGMGEVWLAERDGADFQQRVAVKLLHGGGGEASLARFRRERQILAKLAHPRIARMYDGGVTGDGQAWLAMEVVEGLSLVEHCAKKQLDVPARLRLFVDVCDAVQFAHQNLVVHRDLKPTNILVTADGAPKLLDFGIAKLLEDEESSTSLTAVDERPMTPDYASPEQVRGDRVTTASDIWTLGAILFEVLTGARVGRALQGTSKEKASARTTDDALKRRLKGDLDAIVQKAMRPDPKERYGSVDALAADVRHHLEGTPVAARGEAAGYLLRSLLRRYRFAASVAATVIAALAIGLGATLWQARRAQAEAKKAERAEAFLIDILRSFDPEKGDGHPISQRDILERGEARLDAALGDQPLEQARILRVFAETWVDLDDARRGERPATRARALQEAALGPRDFEVAKTLVVLSDVHQRMGDFARAEREASGAIAIAAPIEPRGATVEVATSQLGTILCHRCEWAEGQRLLRRALDLARANSGEASTSTADRMSDLSVCLSDEGRVEEPVDLARAAANLSEKLRGPTHPTTLLLRHNLASFLSYTGQSVEAEAILRDVLALQRTLYGPDRSMAGTERMLGLALMRQGRLDEAWQLLDGAVRGWQTLYGPDGIMVCMSLLSRGQAERRLGRRADAEASLREALRIQLAQRGEDRTTARIRASLGGVLVDSGRLAEAREELTRALGYLEAHVPLAHYTIEARADAARANAAPAPP